MGYGMQSTKAPIGAIAGQKLAGGYKQGQMPLFTPEQMQLFQSLFSQVSPESYTARLAGGDQSLFNEMEAPAMRQFNELQGGLASRFSGLGGRGSLSSRRSSGFQNQATSAASNFAQDLQSRRQSLQQNAIKELMGMSRDLLHEQPYENYMIRPQPKQSFWQKFMGGAAPIAGSALGGFLGGPMGMAAGSQFGSSIGSAFSGGENQGMNFSEIGNLPTSWGNRGSRLAGSQAGVY